MRDCNTCRHHVQGAHPAHKPRCAICLNTSGKYAHPQPLPLWEPLTVYHKIDPALLPMTPEEEAIPAAAFVEMDPTHGPRPVWCSLCGDRIPHGEVNEVATSTGVEPACRACFAKTWHGGVAPTDTTSKPTNPKDAIGSSKLPLHLVPTTMTAMASIAFLNGALKYGRSNWREAGVRASIYVDACKRHLDAWFEGEEVDPDDGVPHLAAALACIGIIVDAGVAGKLTDDRMYPCGDEHQYRAFIDRLTGTVAALKNQHAGKNPKHYSKQDCA